MSKYRIYRTNEPDPVKAGKRNKWFYTAFFCLIILLFQVPNYCNSLKGLKLHLPVSVIIALTIICLIILLSSGLKSMAGSLQRIGTIEFTRTLIKKEIGDFSTVYGYADVTEMEVGDYFRDIPFSGKSQDSGTKLLKISFRDSSTETLIVSDKPVDPKHRIHLSDSLKTVRKLTGIEVRIKAG